MLLWSDLWWKFIPNCSNPVNFCNAEYFWFISMLALCEGTFSLHIPIDQCCCRIFGFIFVISQTGLCLSMCFHSVWCRQFCWLGVLTHSGAFHPPSSQGSTTRKGNSRNDTSTFYLSEQTYRNEFIALFAHSNTGWERWAWCWLDPAQSKLNMVGPRAEHEFANSLIFVLLTALLCHSPLICEPLLEQKGFLKDLWHCWGINNSEIWELN